MHQVPTYALCHPFTPVDDVWACATTRCLAAIQSVLPLLMKRMSDTLLDDVVKRLAVLASHPTDVEPFVNKVSMMEVWSDLLHRCELALCIVRAPACSQVPACLPMLRIASVFVAGAHVRHFCGAHPSMLVSQSTSKRIPGIKAEDSVVKAMASLMDANSWPVPDTQKAMFTMLKDGAWLLWWCLR